MQSIIETLEFIKNNPKCDSSSLDIDIVTDLYNKGLIEGIEYNPLKGNSFLELRLNIDGSQYLNSLKNSEAEKNNTPNKSADIAGNNNQPPAHGMSFKHFTYSVLVIVFSGIVFWVVKYYFNIQL